MLRKIVWVMTGLAFALCALPSHAQQTWEYYFGTWLGSQPTYQPAQTFAYLSVATSDSHSFDFMLRAYDPGGTGNLASAFGTNAMIGKAVFNTVSGDDPVSISNVQTNSSGTTVHLGTSDLIVGGITFDFFDCFSGGACNFRSGTVQSGEWVSWTLSFASPQVPLLGVPPAAIHVQGFNQNGITSGWYTPISAVPEPETFAMLLAGLGLMGFVARRRQRYLAAA